jgi:hypothetical protein
MNDLIWVGNTLYPRWIVIAVAVVLFIAPFMVASVVQILRR